MHVPIHYGADAPAVLRGAEVILDGLLGYSFVGPPREPEAGLIRIANSLGVPIISLDLPSGLDPDRGTPHDPTIRAALTMTLALPKVGLLAPDAEGSVGELWLADISVPAQAYAAFGIDPGGAVCRLRPRSHRRWSVLNHKDRGGGLSMSDVF